jgi:serine/threonine protein kinase
VASRYQLPFFRHLVDFGTGRLPANATLNQKRYVILDTIGKGGMGAIYLAHDTRTNQTVAIKEMSQARLKGANELQDARQRFQQEAMMLKALHHANLPQVYDWFQENERSYLVMEYIRGHSLLEILKQRNGSPLPVQDVLTYGLQLCDVLMYLHGCFPPIIFRDLKPSNVMLRDDGHLFLVDFGIARFFHKDRSHSDTQIFATPGYAPPEQYGGLTTPQSDLFSLGATLHHCLTGQNPQSHTKAHLFRFLPADVLNPLVPQELSRLVEEMLSVQPQERPADAREVQHRLHQIHPLPENQVTLRGGATVSPSVPTINTQPLPLMPSRLGLGRQLGALVTGLSFAPFKRLVNGWKQSKGRNAGQAVEDFWQQQVSQVVGLRGNQHVWGHSFTIFWLTTVVLLLSGSIYLLATAPDAPRLVGLALIIFSLCLFGFSLSGKHVTDAVPRSVLILMAAAFLLAGMALQAEPDMEALIHSSLQSVTLSQIGACTLIAGALVCLLRLGQRLVWVEQTMLGLLALGCAVLQFGFGLGALQQTFPLLSADLAHTLNVLLIGMLIVLALFTLFRAPQPLQNGSRFVLLLVAAPFTLIQYTSGFQELQHFLAANNSSAAMLQQLVTLSFICTWAPIVFALLALCIPQSWTTRIALAVVVLVVAMMFAYQGQQIPFSLFPGNTYPLNIRILNAETFSQLIGSILFLVACLALFRLPRSRFFRPLDHGALLVGALICARMDDAFWQAQPIPPPSLDMNQSALTQQFINLAGRLPAIAIYILLFALPLALLTLALCHFWHQSHPQARVDPWFKRLRGAIILMERLLALAVVSIALILQAVAGTLQLVLTSGINSLFPSNQPDYLGLFVLVLLLFLAIVGLVLLFTRRTQELATSERIALLLAVLSCLLLIGRYPDFIHLPLLESQVQLTGNILHLPEGLISVLFFTGLLIPPVLAILWVRRSFFARYRELFRLAFLLVITCAILQFFWPLLLPVGLIVFIASVLLLIQIEKVE